MSETFDLSETGLSDLRSTFADDEYFNSIAWPRLRFIEAIKKQLDVKVALDWKVKYSPINRAENRVMISLVDARNKFHFYYAIPLSLRLSVHLFLGDNTFNFFEAHPLLKQQGVIKEDEFRVAATSNTLPHLVLSQKTDRFEQAFLSTDEFNDEKLRESSLYQLLDASFRRFNQSLFHIIDGSYQL